VRWSYDIRKDASQDSFHGNPLVTNDLILVGTDGGTAGHIYAFDKNDGKVAWKYQATSSDGLGRGVGTDIVRLGERVYGVALGDELVCLDLKTGRLNWSFRRPSTEQARSTAPAVWDNRIYFGAINGTVYGLDAASGAVIWSREIGARISASPVIVGNDLYVGAADHYIYRLRRENGDVVSKLELETIPVGPLTPAAGMLLTMLNPRGGPGASKRLACIDLSRMKVIWSQGSTSDWTMRQPLVLANIVLAGNEAGELAAFRLNDGTPEWTHQFKGTLRSIGNSGNVLYVGTLEGTVYAYDTAGLWR
jgi:outer membrane protein assembly factor BamB